MRAHPSGEVEAIFTLDPIANASGLASGDEIWIMWAGSVEETVSTLIHEGTHNLDPYLVSDSLFSGPVAETSLSREGNARAFQYEQRAMEGLPAFDAAETRYREARDAALAAGKTRQEANVEADRAMLKEMTDNSKRYSVESREQLEERVNKLPPLPEPPPPTLSPPESPLEQELFGDLPASQDRPPTKGGGFEDEPTVPDIQIPQIPAKANPQPVRQEPAEAGQPRGANGQAPDRNFGIAGGGAGGGREDRPQGRLTARGSVPDGQRRSDGCRSGIPDEEVPDLRR